MTAKLAYLMRHGGDFDPGAMREIIYNMFAGSFENDCGSTAEVIDALSTAIFRYRCATEDDLDIEKAFIKNSRQAEDYFCARLRKILLANGLPAPAVEDYVTWPDNLSVETTWEKEVLRELALIQAGHDLVVRDQLKQLWEAEKAKGAEHAESSE